MASVVKQLYDDSNDVGVLQCGDTSAIPFHPVMANRAIPHPALFWRIACSYFDNDDNDLTSVYSEDRSNRVAFLILVLYLIGMFVYFYVKD